MADEPPNSSWHPALMPNSANDSSSRADATDATRSPPSTEAIRAEPSIASQELELSKVAIPANDEDHVADASLSTEGNTDDGSDAWLASAEPAPQESIAEQEVQLSSGATSTSTDTAAVQETQAPKPAVQHSSSMSFARTSHEVNFNDDDESGDWTLSRTDTDPFKFMAPNDRTNSFPVVPPIAPLSGSHHDAPLQPNEALEVVKEAERDADLDEQQYRAEHTTDHQPDRASQAQGALRRGHAPSRSIGGEILASDDAMSGTRFEEGVPLIPQSSAGREPESGGGFAQSFTDDNRDDDDFFSQTREPEAGEPEPFTLERKSTMQVLGSMETEQSRQSTLERTFEERASQFEDNVDDISSMGIAIPSDSTSKLELETPSQSEDLATKWQEAFADSDEEDAFLDDSATENKDFNSDAFLGSDDEGFLDDAEDSDHPSQAVPAATRSVNATSGQTPASNPYKPSNAPQAPFSPSSATTSLGAGVSAPFYNPPVPPVPFNAAAQFGQPAQLRPEPPRAQSFADKSKSGYASPYDLPTDLVSAPVVKPRKRTSMQQLPRASPPTSQPPPMRSTSMFTPTHQLPSSSPPTSSHAAQGPPMNHKGSVPVLRAKGSFFEELPMAPKPRPTSRQSYAPPPQSAPLPASLSTPSMLNQTSPAPIANQSPIQPSSSMGNLVAPERVSPYASIPTVPHMPPPSGSTARYSPAPTQATAQGGLPPAAASRYSPAPPATRLQNSYSPTAPSIAAPPVLPHQPRTSSPLAHFETNSNKPQAAGHGPNGEVPLLERRSASSHDHRVNRVPSLPTTREVEEEDQPSATLDPATTHGPTPPTSAPRYTPTHPPGATRQTPPPPTGIHGPSTLSPPKRTNSNYLPQNTSTDSAGFVPPVRAQTQSPGAQNISRSAAGPSDSLRRPSTSYSPASPVLVKSAQPPFPGAGPRRGQSLTMNMVPPTDGREQDVLQRWQGCPIMTWGVGGIMVTSFPKSIPRYGMNQTQPAILRVPGEPRVRSIKDIEPLSERLAKFPGPLRGKSKKREVIVWLTAGIEALERDLPDVSFHSQLSLEAKRAMERLLLWKILCVFIEFDGALEGTVAVEKAVRDLLSPGTVTPTSDDDALFPTNARGSVQTAPVTAMQADGADAATVEQMRNDLMKGDRETAVWSAVDKRLWAHAMLISHTVSPDLYKRVAQEFVRKEVNYPGHNNEPMAALYNIMSGNQDECVDELVPAHARAGFQLVSTSAAANSAQDIGEGLDKWRETLTLVLSNRSPDDIRGMNSLGNLLAGYGRAEAAHICYMFSRGVSVFGGLDDPKANFVLVGSDHKQQPDQFAKETEALELSEVYEYGLTLVGSQTAAAGAPHLAAYKLQHAMTLAEYGYRDKALQYCDAIAASMSSQTRRSPYHHTILMASVDDFMTRLKQAPKVETGSWMSKPSMNKVSDSMWNRFNKFVAGDEAGNNGHGATGDADSPFAHVSTTPSLSRTPSDSNFDVYNRGSSSQPTNISTSVPSGGFSKYAPMTPQPAGLSSSYDPASSYVPVSRRSIDQGVNEPAHNPYAPGNHAITARSTSNGSYAPSVGSSNAQAYQPHNPGAPATMGGYQQHGIHPSPDVPSFFAEGGDSGSELPNQGDDASRYGYEPPQLAAPGSDPNSNDVAGEGGFSGYEPPSYQPQGYEPPSYEPQTFDEGDDDVPKPKKKSFMDDDEDDVPALRPKDKSKADVDRENQEMFRKAAEEDAKRAAAQQTGKKGWGLSGWFGGGKKPEANMPSESPNKPIRAKLGEASSFVYDPELKRWINKKPGAENIEAKSATPPPPRGGPSRANSGTPPPMSSTPPPPGRLTMPPSLSSARSISNPTSTPDPASPLSLESLGGPPVMTRSVSNTSATGPPSGPPSRPTTSMSNASSIDDLLGAAAPRKAGQKKTRKSGRYIDVMAK